MYCKVVSVLLLLSLFKPMEGQLRFMVDGIIKQYKRTTLPFREDVFQGNLPIMEEYNYVIVGAGPSGCVLANRLSEDPGTTVLLLEAGGEPNIVNETPILHLLTFDTDYNWKFSSQYNPDVCRSMIDNTCPWPSGKGIGGGTLVNAMLYTRGNKKDYDEWAELGNVGWSYDDLLKYFKKLESTKIPGMKESPYRGTGGPISVSYSPYTYNASSAFIDGGRELGYPVVDYNVPYKSGVGRMQLSMRDGKRSSASSAYLKPVASRPNLHLVQRAMVSRVLIDPVSKTARKVEFFKKGKRRLVRATREIILSAGTFGSPKILMLSGIGPKEHLKDLNINVLADLPVGNNLQEHIGATLLPFTAKTPNFSPNYAEILPSLPIVFFRYMVTKDGFPSSTGVDAIAYVSSRYGSDDLPDIELLLIGSSYSSEYGEILRRSVGVRDDVYKAYYKPLENEISFSIWVMGCYPKSRGTVRLASSNPFDKPIINNNFLNYTEDLNVIIDGIKMAVKMSKTKAMKAHGVRLYKRHLPGCEELKFGSDKYWGCTVRQITAQFHHQVGTCKMAPDGDPTSVVDNRLRVRGIRNLRVVDSSIMPKIPAGHTQVPAYMIGEKAADMIKQGR